MRSSSCKPANQSIIYPPNYRPPEYNQFINRINQLQSLTYSQQLQQWPQMPIQVEGKQKKDKSQDKQKEKEKYKQKEIEKQQEKLKQKEFEKQKEKLKQKEKEKQKEKDQKKPSSSFWSCFQFDKKQEQENEKKIKLHKKNKKQERMAMHQSIGNVQQLLPQAPVQMNYNYAPSRVMQPSLATSFNPIIQSRSPTTLISQAPATMPLQFSTTRPYQQQQLPSYNRPMSIPSSYNNMPMFSSQFGMPLTQSRDTFQSVKLRNRSIDKKSSD